MSLGRGPQLGWVFEAACPHSVFVLVKLLLLEVLTPKSVLSRVWLHTKLHATNLFPSSVLGHNPIASPLFASLLDPQVLERKFSGSVDAFNRRDSVQCSL